MKKLIFLSLILLNTSCSIFTNSVRIYQTDYNILYVAGKINNTITTPFLLDTGASEVILPKNIYFLLKLNGTIKKENILPSKEFLLADGSSIICERILINELRIGNKTFYNVEASISDSTTTPPILGGNVLKQFGKIKIDYKNNKLIYEVNLFE